MTEIIDLWLEFVFMSPEAEVLLTAFGGSLIRSILVVDDEEPIRMVLTELLEDCGYRVLAACDVADARRILDEVVVDLVFSDINMPGRENGFALEKWIRQHYPDTKVLLTSGYPQAAADTRDLLEPLIAKPYRCSTVLQRVEQILDRQRRFRQLEYPAVAMPNMLPHPNDPCGPGSAGVLQTAAHCAE